MKKVYHGSSYFKYNYLICNFTFRDDVSGKSWKCTLEASNENEGSKLELFDLLDLCAKSRYLATTTPFKRSHPTTPQSIASSIRFSNEVITWPLNPTALLFLSWTKIELLFYVKTYFNYAKLPMRWNCILYECELFGFDKISLQIGAHITWCCPSYAIRIPRYEFAPDPNPFDKLVIIAVSNYANWWSFGNVKPNFEIHPLKRFLDGRPGRRKV